MAALAELAGRQAALVAGMNQSGTLLRYLGRQFAVNFLIGMSILLTVIYLSDSVELIRRAANRPDVSFEQIAEMSFFQLPQVGQQAFQYAVLGSAMYTLWRLTRTSELVVLRAVGVSAWQFLLPALLAAAVIGIVKVTIVNPIGSTLSTRFEQMDNALLRGKTSAIDISAGGLWLRQSGVDAYSIIHARTVDVSALQLKDVSIFFLTNDDDLTGRLDASQATLVGSSWEVRDGWLNQHSGEPPTFVAHTSIPTDITGEKITDSFATPNTLSFWQIPHYIRTMEATGISAVRLRLYYQGLLADPVLFAGLVLIAAAAALRQTRRGGTLLVIAVGVTAGFALFFLNSIVRALGVAETIPVALAAWAPAGISLLGGGAALLYLEDG
jgi:lipopolysaccharide export system permease protein